MEEAVPFWLSANEIHALDCLMHFNGLRMNRKPISALNKTANDQDMYMIKFEVPKSRLSRRGIEQYRLVLSDGNQQIPFDKWSDGHSLRSFWVETYPRNRK